jgi:hypothetical protein
VSPRWVKYRPRVLGAVFIRVKNPANALFKKGKKRPKMPPKKHLKNRGPKPPKTAKTLIK